MPGKLYLIPAPIGDSAISCVIPAHVTEVVNAISHYIVENERTARRTLIKLGIDKPIDSLTFYLLNRHTDKNELPAYLDILYEHDAGLLSEAGVPAIADPGSEIISMAHIRNIRVVPLVGPSSILMAMMASGMNGQNFAFVGYLPVKQPERVFRLRQLEQRSLSEKQSQIFIETPYRNNQLLADILAVCAPDTLLCIAAAISTDGEFIKTGTIAEWRKKRPELNKKPSIFILHRF
jgi:16S rRNA (cytidine1402-2'-O)-methyltransferase